MTDIVEVVIADESWTSIDLDLLANRAIRLAFLAVNLPTNGYEISLLACDDARITELNGEYRGIPLATNVLSWPAFELAAVEDGGSPRPLPKPDGVWAESVGDLAIAYETCQREAISTGVDFADHVTHLILHGCLHLFGYDHERDGDAALMEALETMALASVGIDDPYLRSELVGMEK